MTAQVGRGEGALEGRFGGGVQGQDLSSLFMRKTRGATLRLARCPGAPMVDPIRARYASWRRPHIAARPPRFRKSESAMTGIAIARGHELVASRRYCFRKRSIDAYRLGPSRVTAVSASNDNYDVRVD